jgi:SAM-dependent methyltransferase
MSAVDHSHAELMDGVYRYQRHVYDLTRKYYLLGRDRLIDRLDVPPGGTVLELGCGTGRNLVKAAQAFPQAQLGGLDISAEMLETASVAIGRRGLSARVRLAQGDASAFDAESLFGRHGSTPSMTAARCTSSTSAARSVCPAGSRLRCAPGWRNSTYPRVILCAKCLNRNACVSAQACGSKRSTGATLCTPW